MTEQIDQGDTTIAIAGDWHGDGRWAVKQLKSLARLGIRTVLHVGDFGLYRGPSWSNYFADLEAVCAEHGITIWITDGNHEDHSWRLELAAKHGNEPAWITDHIHLLPRGYRWTHGGRTFVSLGGAPSINYQYLTEGFDWFAEEFISQDDAAKAVAGGRAEIMVCHDSPAPSTRTVEHIRATNPGGWPFVATRYAARGAHVLTEVYEQVRPKLLFHGHYHVADDVTFDDGRRIYSLNKNDGPFNIALLDLKTLTVDPLRWSVWYQPPQTLSWESAAV